MRNRFANVDPHNRGCRVTDDTNQDKQEPKNVLVSFLESGFDELFKQPEVRSYCLTGLEGAGCKPPSNHLLFFCLRKAVGAAAGFGQGVFRTRLAAMVDNNPKIAGFLQTLLNLNRQARDRNHLKTLLLNEMPPAEAGQIQADEAMSLEVITALYNRQAIAGLSGEFETLVSGLREDLRDDLAALFADFTEPNLTWSLQEDVRSIADAIRYDSQKFEFVGRDKEMDELRHFLGDCTIGGARNRFKWLLITGEGGDGKTRLALEFVRSLSAPWTGGRLTLDGLSKLLDEGRWTPRRPTLLVIDYPAQAPARVGRLLSYLDKLAGDTDMPVRVLMMEREAAGDWVSEMLPGESPVVREHCFRRERYESGWRIDPLHPAHVLHIMVRRFRDEGLDDPDVDALFQAVMRVDPRKVRLQDGDVLPIPRPLFGAAIAELAVEHLKSGAGDLDAYLADLDAESVFERLIVRDRDMRWKPVAGDRLELHENLLALATMCLGLKRGDFAGVFRQKKDILGEFLPAPGVAGLTAISDDTMRMMGSPDPEDMFRPYEPDLLGQYFVLRRLDRLQAQGLMDAFLNTAFELGGDNAAIFSLRVALDFATRFKARGFLWPEIVERPSTGDILSKLTVDLTRMFGDANSWSDVDSLFVHIDALRHAFPDHQDIALHEAMAAVNVTIGTSKARDWDRVDAMIAHIDVLRHAFPDQQDIALNEAMATVTVTKHAGEAGD
ncbi:MAG: ATP-binding protein, partial [Hyphomonas sp.]|nr:ATP-binding protein [Hyphomonas sp.]